MNAERESLAKRQRKMVARLLRGGALPAGIAENQAARTARMLLNKRRREVVLAAPGICQELGKEFEALFAEYAAKQQYPSRGGPAADAANFCRRLLISPTVSLNIAKKALTVCTKRGFPIRFSKAGGVILLGMRGRVYRMTSAKAKT